MTHELIPLQDDRQRNFYQYLATHPLYINLEPSLQSISSPQSKKLSENNEASLRLFRTESRRQELDNALRKLSEKDIPGKAHINEYLRDTPSPSELCLPCLPNGMSFSFLFHRGEIAKQRFKNEPISLGSQRLSAMSYFVPAAHQSVIP